MEQYIDFVLIRVMPELNRENDRALSMILKILSLDLPGLRSGCIARVEELK